MSSHGKRFMQAMVGSLRTLYDPCKDQHYCWNEQNVRESMGQLERSVHRLSSEILKGFFLIVIRSVPMRRSASEERAQQYVYTLIEGRFRIAREFLYSS